MLVRSATLAVLCAAAALGAGPRYFSFQVSAEGNYRVTVTIGDPDADAATTVKAELRRPQIAGGGEVRLKPRERASEAIAWDDRITLALFGRVSAVDVERADDVPTLYIPGDSTSTDQPREPYRPCDYVFIQMGHNEQKERGEGVGAFTTYKAELERFVNDARRHGATPVLITSMNRLTWGPDGHIVNSLGDYPEAVRRVAREQNIALIDLNVMSKTLYEAIGPENAPRLFAGKDTTHHSDYGSYELAKCVVEGIRASGLPLAKMLVDTLPFDPAHPDPYDQFDVPPDPPSGAGRPYGQ